MKRKKWILCVLSMTALILGGCRYVVNESEGGTIIVDRLNGSVVRVGVNSVVELPVVNDPEFVPGSVVYFEEPIAGQVLDVTASAKTMNGLVLWYAIVEPHGQVSAEPDSEYQTNFGRLRQWTESSWQRIVLVLRDEDGFTVDEIEISLSDISVSVVDASGEVVGYRYEGSVDLPLEAIQLVDTLDFKWQLPSE